MARSPAPDRDQEGALDPRAVHLAQVLIHRHAGLHMLGHPHLGGEVGVKAGLIVRHLIGREQIYDDIDSAWHGSPF